jgi:LytS/YehU family sensor histidine kinase
MADDRFATRLRDWPILLAGWSVFGVVQAVMNTLPSGISDRTLLALFGFYVPLAWFWAAATPVIGWWDDVVSRRVSGTLARLALHVPSMIAAATLHTWVRRELAGTIGSTPQVGFSVTLLFFADLTVIAYIGALWASQALRARNRLLQQQRETHELESQLSAARLEYLEMQLRPHFLFNTLNTVAELGHEAPDRAARMLRDVIALLKSVVARSHSGEVTLGDELAALDSYLSIQRVRFKDWIVIEEDIDAAAHPALLPQFILQPLVENAVQHGLSRRSAQGRLAIRARVVDGRLLVSVHDNGVGLQDAAAPQRGLGLRNVRERIEALYGVGGTLTVAPDPAGGTTALIDVPFLTTRGPVAGSPAGTAPATDSVGATIWNSRLMLWVEAHPWLSLVVAWSAVGLLRVQHSYIYLAFRDRLTTEALLSAVRFDMGLALVWMVLTPFVLWCARRIPFRRGGVTMALASHVALAFAFSLGHTALARMLSGFTDQPLWSQGSAAVYAWNVAVYAILLTLVNLRQVDGWIRERALAASRLRLELQDARFHKVMVELRPSVLIDTLEHLRQLVQLNPVRADNVLADVGEFLRRTLDTVFETEIPMRDECESLRAYGRVLSVAAAPGMALTLAVPLDLMDEQVPNGILRAAVDEVLTGEPRSDVAVNVSAERAGDHVVVSATSSTRTHSIASARRSA